MKETAKSKLLIPLAILLTLPNALANFLFEPRPIISPLYSGVQIRRTLVVGIRQHGNDRHKDLLHAEDGPPPLLGRLVEVMRVLPGIVKDGDANFPVLVNIRMPHFRLEWHRGRLIREVFGEDEPGLEEAALVKGAIWTHDQNFPIVDIFVGEPHRNEIDWILGQLCMSPGKGAWVAVGDFKRYHKRQDGAACTHQWTVSSGVQSRSPSL